MQWLGLTLAFVSAIAVNWAYAREHDAAAAMPPFSPRRPVRFVSLLLGNRRWLVGFATETAGWLVYVAALRLAPISLVQAICASGIAVLAFATAHGHPARLARHEQIAVLIAFAGLVLLAFSLVDTRQVDHSPGWAPVVLWLGCSVAGALTLARMGIGLVGGAAPRPVLGVFFPRSDLPQGCSSPAATSPPSSSATAASGLSPSSLWSPATRSAPASSRAPSNMATL
jgi:hypothetical protein